jgi:hypothetical protein
MLAAQFRQEPDSRRYNAQGLGPALLKYRFNLIS